MKLAGTTVILPCAPDFPLGGYDGAPRYGLLEMGTLEANVAMVGDERDSIAFVSVDSLFAGRRLSAAIEKAFENSFNLEPGRVFVLASHTHFAPMLDEGKPLIGEASPRAVDDAIDAITSAIAKLTPRPVGSAKSGRGVSSLSVNRRLPWRWPTAVRVFGKVRSHIYMADNPQGPRDPSIALTVWYSPEGTALAAFWSFACHPVSFHDPRSVSPEFIGVVRDALRARLGTGIPVIFAPGCMGDVRPRSPVNWARHQSLFDTLKYGPRGVPFSKEQWIEWSSTLASEVLEIEATATSLDMSAGAVAGSSLQRLPLSSIFQGVSSTDDLIAKAAWVDGVGRLVTLSSEPVTAIADFFRRSPRDLVLGYEGDVFGYLPSEKEISEGGYEADRFMPFFGMRGRWRDNSDAELRKLAARLGGDRPAASSGQLAQ